MTYLTDRVSTGVDGLDLMLGGGFPSRSIVLLCGGNGSGKTIFSLQFTAAAVKRGEPCVYVNLEEPMTKKYGYAEAFGWNLKGAEREGLLISLDLKSTPQFSGVNDSIYSIGNDSEYSVEHRMIEAVKKINAKNIVVDPLTSILVNESKSGGIRHAVNQLYEAVRLLGCNGLITSEGVPSRGDFYMEHFLSDGVILMNKDIRDFKLVKTLLVDKMRGIEFDDQPRRYSISERGLQVYNSEPVLI